MKKTLSLGLIAFTLLLVSCAGDSNSEIQSESSEIQNESNGAIKSDKPLIHKDGSMTGVVRWEGSMLGMYTHYGLVTVKNAKLTYDKKQISSGEINIDMTTITAMDDNFKVESGKTREDLVKHLTSPDFFDVANFPIASFVITSVGENGKEITGEMTIKGKTKEETLNIGYSDNNSLKGKLIINRKDYGIMFEPSKEMILSDEINLTIKLSNTK